VNHGGKSVAYQTSPDGLISAEVEHKKHSSWHEHARHFEEKKKGASNSPVSPSAALPETGSMSITQFVGLSLAPVTIASPVF
jgi:hypothetical protein